MTILTFVTAKVKRRHFWAWKSIFTFHSFGLFWCYPDPSGSVAGKGNWSGSESGAGILSGLNVVDPDQQRCLKHITRKKWDSSLELSTLPFEQRNIITNFVYFFIGFAALPDLNLSWLTDWITFIILQYPFKPGSDIMALFWFVVCSRSQCSWNYIWLNYKLSIVLNDKKKCLNG